MEEKKLPMLSFCTPVYGDAESIEKLADSIIDQDYPEIELIMCVDGCPESEVAVKKIVEKYKDDKHRVVGIYLPENKGACVARNEAAKEAKGEYLSFLPADANLLPGMARVWMTHLMDNPDYDFLYGGYRFLDKFDTEETIKEWADAAKMELDDYVAKVGFQKKKDGTYLTQQGFDYLSEPFDPYFLDSHNYIDGSFPLKREAFDRIGGWDPKIKSLQDWDFWLSVVKTGGKGLFFRDIFFETTFPHKGGLSDDSSKNWVERTQEIKDKHGIKKRDICVTSLGAPFHGRHTARLLDADYKEMPSFKPHLYEMVYLLGFFPSVSDLCGQVFINCQGKRVIHWIGSDIWQMQQMDLHHRNVLTEYFKNNIDVHLCEADFTQKELKDLGINAKIVPIPPRWWYPVTPLPEKFTVAVYQPFNNKAFYLPEVCREIAELCPDIDFKFFGDDSQVGQINNVEFIGHTNDMEKLINECSAIMRLTVHDGLPINVLEFIGAGRNALVNIPLKHCMVTKTVEPKVIAEALQKMKDLPLNEEGSAYWRKKASHKKYKNALYKLMEYKPEEYWENRADSWVAQSDKGYSLPEEDYKLIREWLGEIEYDSVLDLGCGSGRFTKDFEGKSYLGIDISKKLIKTCQERFSDKEFIQCKVEDMDPEWDYDLIFSYTTLEHITEDEWPKAVEAMKKVGKQALIIEPTDFRSVGYCHNHDYEKDFHVIKKIKLSDKTMFLVDLTK